MRMRNRTWEPNDVRKMTAVLCSSLALLMLTLGVIVVLYDASKQGAKIQIVGSIGGGSSLLGCFYVFERIMKFTLVEDHHGKDQRRQRRKPSP